ncbi:F-box protein At4g22280-like isoform X1 [Fagus crenata]
MDEGSLIHDSETQELSKKHSMNKGRNRLCNLPDVVLQHILSFLGTKEAVRTSVLSKKWQYVWVSIPNLNFIQGAGTIYDRALFMNLVERALVLRKSLSIQKLSLSCNVLCDACRINSWVFGAVRHKVQVLDLCLFLNEESFVLPRSLFTCESIKVLNLQMCYNLRLPSSIFFPSLKIFTLKHVIFPDDQSTQQLFSGCPVLEELTLDDCYWENIKAISISAPMLKSLVIYDFLDVKSHCQVIIFGMSLKSFVYEGRLKNDYCLCNTSSLVDACILVDERHLASAYHANKLIKELSNVESLVLTPQTVEALSYREEFLAQLPKFLNLTHLELCVDFADMASGALMKVFQNSPCLTSLEFNGGIELTREDWTLDPVPPCFLTHLKTIKIVDFLGTGEEVLVVRSFLRNTAVLEKLVIFWSEEFSGQGDFHKQKAVNDDLLALPKGSQNCVISFS